MNSERPIATPINTGSAGKTAAASDLGSARVLIVDGDVMSQRVVASILQQGGYDTVGESNGEAVFSALEAHAIDVVLIDMGLNGGGTELLTSDTPATWALRFSKAGVWGPHRAEPKVGTKVGYVCSARARATGCSSHIAEQTACLRYARSPSCQNRFRVSDTR